MKMTELNKEKIQELKYFLEKEIVKPDQIVDNICLAYSNLKDLDIPLFTIRMYYNDPGYMDKEEDDEETDFHLTILGPLVDPRRTTEDFEHIIFNEYDKILKNTISVFWFSNRQRVMKKVFYLEFQGARVKMKPVTYRKNSLDISELVIAIYKELFRKEPSDSLKLFLELKK
jgi:hypothetical protein